MTKRIFTNPVPGVNFDEATGKLYVFSEESIEVMQGWLPMAWIKTLDQGWHCHRPCISIPAYNVEEKILELHELRIKEINAGNTAASQVYRSKKMARLKWLATIPPHVRAEVSRYSDRHWHMLAFLARCGAAAHDLSISNPALAYALASNWVFHQPAVQQPLRAARRLLSPGKKQRAILGWLGFPDSEFMRKGLAKIPAGAVSLDTLLYLRGAVNDPRIAKRVSHVHELNAGVLRILCDPRITALATPSLLEEISTQSSERKRATTAYVLLDIRRLSDYVYGSPRCRKYFRSIREVQQVHDELSVMSAQMNEDGSEIVFPAPPIPGSEEIVPISDVRMLVEEARQQHNCVLGYRDEIALKRNFYLYRVLEPQRCTLALRKHSDSWRIAELRSVCNEPADISVRRSVQKWLGSAGSHQV
jgi:hypothetical protein